MNTEETNIDSQLSQLEARIRDLKFDYDRYFTKDLKLEPIRKKEDVERLILRLSKINFFKANQKFTYENVISRFIALKSYWDKKLRLIEAGTAKRTEAAQSGSPEHTGDDPYRHVYDEYVRLVTSLNSTAKLSPYEAVRQTLESKRKELVTQYKCRDVEFKVEYEGKKLKFKAVPRY
ncbi:MAG: hypothetical protein M1491_00610 [Deltaproteobacteria bacterium]|nr:hypothetical protein [Deltaproteobacteria bacterium]MCL5277477.1 hypothetical protein [Deltaproteobacteria bacterium]